METSKKSSWVTRVKDRLRTSKKLSQSAVTDSVPPSSFRLAVKNRKLLLSSLKHSKACQADIYKIVTALYIRLRQHHPISCKYVQSLTVQDWKKEIQEKKVLAV